MIAVIAYWLVGKGIDVRAARPLAWAIMLVIVAIVVFGGSRIYLASRDAQVIENHEAKTSAKLERTGRQADTSAAQRVETRRRVEGKEREEFDNATAGMPDEGLTDRQRLDLCRELREAGAPVVPECRDVRTGAKARP